MTRRAKTNDAGEDLVRPKQRLTDKEGAATYLDTTVSHIDRLVYERKIPYFKVGGKVRFDLTDLDRWLRNHRTEAAS